MADQDIALMAHLLRRAGFGASLEEIDACAARGYDAVVEELLNPEKQPAIDDDLLMRYHPAYVQAAGIETNVQEWVYRLINNPRQLQEKMALFWHMIFCAGHSKLDHGKDGHSKLDHGKEMGVMIGLFREHGMGNFRDLLMVLSTSPQMMYYLDNTESHKVAINENYGRELLELFSMGVGKDNAMNYTEDDVKACARAFTGWNVAPSYPVFPYGRSIWQFRYDPADHDDSEKTFLGQPGRWNGEDIIDIICKQPATARFISRHMYNFFVADEVPVPSWRLTPPKDPKAIATLEKAYFDSGYEIRAMLRALLTSDFFKAPSARFARVRSPAEMVVGLMRQVGEHRNQIKPGLNEIAQEPKYMGMDLMNPPTVEGWHTGQEWIDSGTLVERVNFAAEYLSKTDLSGVRAMIERVTPKGERLAPEEFVNRCIDVVGNTNIADSTREALVAHVRNGGDIRLSSAADRTNFTRRCGEMFQMIAATAEFQFC